MSDTGTTEDGPSESHHLPIRIQQWHLALLATICSLALVYGSLLPLKYRPADFKTVWQHFVDPHNFPRAGELVLDRFVNLLIAVPMGFFAAGTLLLFRRTLVPALMALLPTLLICGIVSFAAEILQGWFPPRNPALDDVRWQLFGALAGWGLWITVGPLLVSSLESVWSENRVRTKLEWLLLAYVLGFLLLSAVPFDVVYSIRQWAGKLHSHRIEIIPFTSPSDLKSVYSWLADCLLAVPIGWWARFAFWNRPGLRSLLASACLSVSVIATVELGQLFLESRFCSATDFVWGSVGCLIGVMTLSEISTSSLPPASRPRSLLILAGIVIYALLATGIFWSPFPVDTEPEAVVLRLKQIELVPFTDYQSQNSLHAIDSILRNILWWLPGGVIAGLQLRRLPARSGLRVLALLVVTAVASVWSGMIEFGRAFLVNHHPAVTPWLLRIAGLLAGMLLTLWLLSGRQPPADITAPFHADQPRTDFS